MTNKIKIGLACVILILVSFVALFLGRYSIAPLEVISTIGGRLNGVVDQSFNATVIWDIRIPRVILNILVGFGLSISGAALQGIFKNNLVSPDILGVSSGAGFGAAFALLVFPKSNNILLIAAFVMGLVSMFLSYIISKVKLEDTTLSLVLSGVIVGSFFNALISFIKLVADTESVLPAITYWLMGSFVGSSYDKLVLASIPIIIGSLVILLFRWRINILSLGDEEAESLGVSPKKTRIILIIATTLVTSGSVMVAGIIGWVGMLIPNMSREIVGADNRYLLIFSGIMGAIFLVLVDLLARTLTSAEIPIGILTAILGTPIFIYVFGKRGVK